MRPFKQATIKYFGPFACAMKQILHGGHLEKKRKNKIQQGIEMKNVSKQLGLFSACFFLYRGLSMKPDQL